MKPAFAGTDTADIVPFRFTLIPAHKPDELHVNIRSSIARKLPVVLGVSPANDLDLCIVGGGPSAADTLPEIRAFVEAGRGYVAAINGSLRWLIDRGVVPTMCGVCDPSPHMAGIVDADPRVTYFLASIVHPSVYDKLLAAGCRIYRWNISSVPGSELLLNQIERDWFMVGGGSTMGLRWLTLGYNLGFRRYHLHGFDSSFRGTSSHAYPDHQDAKEWIWFGGRQTRPNFIGQVSDFIGWMDRLMEADVDPVSVKVYGDGLLQDKFNEWKAINPGCHEGPPKPARKSLTAEFVWPADDVAKASALEDVKAMDQFLAAVPRRGVVIQAGGHAGVYAVHLARRFRAVHTFEPEPTNYACLSANIAGARGNINAVNAALGASDGACGLTMMEPANTGAWATMPSRGAVEMRCIDGLGLYECDLIWLDVEGGELAALEGAAKTVEKFWPAIIVEEKSEHVAEVRDWLHARGYVGTAHYGNDRLYLPTGVPNG